MSISGSPISGETISGTPGAFVAIAPLYVSSTTGMNVGDKVEIMLDSGELFNATITQIPSPGSPGQILLSKALPYQASSGNIVIDLTQTTIVAPSRAELSTDLNG